jgi:hypothetical protein
MMTARKADWLSRKPTIIPARKEQELEKIKIPTRRKPTSGDDCDCWMTFNSEGNRDNDDETNDGRKDMGQL